MSTRTPATHLHPNSKFSSHHNHSNSTSKEQHDLRSHQAPQSRMMVSNRRCRPSPTCSVSQTGHLTTMVPPHGIRQYPDLLADNGNLASQHIQTSPQQLHEQPQATQTSPSRTIHVEEVESRPPPPQVAHELSGSPRNGMPPPGAMRNDSVLEGTQSPSTLSTGSTISGPPYFVGSAYGNIEPPDQRHGQLQMVKRPVGTLPSQPDASPYSNARFATSVYATNPAAASVTSYCSPTEPPYQSVPTGPYPQRPLPSNFPPAPPSAVQSAPALPTSNPWEHHHYISPSSQATFPQSQDRYICPTCSKAFSRPSSLKIHSHSHTGEKPFRCPHAGCGKAFSVRSNMKRHERGCHSGMNTPPHLPALQHPHTIARMI